MQQFFMHKLYSCHIFYYDMKKLDYTEFLNNNEVIENMNKEYENLLRKTQSVTNFCTIFEYMCDKRNLDRKIKIKVIIEKLRKHSLYSKYSELIENVYPKDVIKDEKEIKLEFYIGKDFLKTLHKIESIEQTIIMELKALKCFYLEQLIEELEKLLTIRKIINRFYFDNCTCNFQ